MAERTPSLNKPTQSGFVFSLRYQSYDSMVGHGESEHYGVEIPLAARGVKGAISAARGEWNKLAPKARIEMETAWVSPDGRGRASEYWHAVVYPHSPRLGHSMELQALEGFEQPDPSAYLERLKAFQEKPEAIGFWGLLEGYEARVDVNGEGFARIWPVVRKITRLTEHHVAFVNDRIYFGGDQADLQKRITHEPNYEAAFFARIGGIKREESGSRKRR